MNDAGQDETPLDLPGEPPVDDDRRLVLPPRPSPGAPRSRAASHGGTTAVMVIGGCIVIVVTLLFLAASLVENWRDSRMRQVKGREDVPQDVMPPRDVPPPDPALARATLRGNPGEAFSDGSYPAEAIRAGEQGRVVARLRIDRSGTPRECVVETSSRSRSLDAATCRIALARVRFSPARDERGAAIESSYTLPVRWVLPDG